MEEAPVVPNHRVVSTIGEVGWELRWIRVIRTCLEKQDLTMVEAEQFAEEDKKVREKIEARNGLENYVYSMKNTLNDSEKGVADKISDVTQEVNALIDDLAKRGLYVFCVVSDNASELVARGAADRLLVVD